MTLNAGQLGATEVLAAAIASLDSREGIGASSIDSLDHGVAATVHLPSGDTYRVTVEWLGDREGAAT